ncbi:MAG: 3'(2'),5'-bisphosphate nucleotidase CysQ [Sulfuricurvum sp.]|jgi:3'(2'), 5'-bisphosphate nucleotidase|nr:3'(2'),5'-bisphosphate nucleotidase CysQ [Sulfuricurvum sp.]
MLKHINIEDVIFAARSAGDAILEVYRQDFHVEYKEDLSPLTLADKKANEVITTILESLPVRLPVLSEEGKNIPYTQRRLWEWFWMIDPLDGTKEFIKKNGEFTVNIALIHQDTPVLGVVYAPVLDNLYWGIHGLGAYKNGHRLPLEMPADTRKKLRIVASKSHMNEATAKYIETLSEETEKIELISVGSSLKLCMVAEGSADIYPRLSPTMEWDTAAADAIVREAKKTCVNYRSGEMLRYNKADMTNEWFVVQ